MSLPFGAWIASELRANNVLRIVVDNLKEHGQCGYTLKIAVSGELFGNRVSLSTG
jgi:hypothetical protein